MQLINVPAKLPLPFASSGAKNTIPTASQIGITPGAASLTDGFPPLTRTPIAAGGVPPSGLDMNGILFELSAILRWANAGGGYPYDSSFASDANVNGYPKGARVMRSDGLGYWLNTTDNNTADPESAGAAAAGWVPDYTSGASAITMTNANVTLTPLQYGKPVVVISGALTANLNLIFPAIYGQWLIINNCTGSFSITAKTSAGAGVAIPVQSVRNVFGDGTNISTSFPRTGAWLDTVSVSTSQTIGASFVNKVIFCTGGTPTLTVAASGFVAGDRLAFMATAPCTIASAGPLFYRPGKTSNSSLSLSVGDNVSMFFDGVNFCIEDFAFNNTPTVLRSYISGLTLSTAGSSGTMSITAGQCADSANAVLMNLPSAITKTISSWAVGSGSGGLDTGSIVDSSWYYFYVIRRPDTGVVDVCFSLSSTAPTLPTNYTQYRYIGAGRTDAYTHWTKFTQVGDEFYWDTPPLDISNASSGTTANTATISVPRGRKMKVFANALSQSGSFISDPANADLAPSGTVSPLISANTQGGNLSVWTNSSAQIRYRCVVSGYFYFATLGWTDLRGKDL